MGNPVSQNDEDIDAGDIWYTNEEYCAFKQNTQKLAWRIRKREKQQQQARKWVRSSTSSSGWLGDFSDNSDSDIVSAAATIASAFSTTTNNDNNESYMGVVERAHGDIISQCNPEKSINNSMPNNKQFELQLSKQQNHYGEQQDYCSLFGILSYWWYSLNMETLLDDDDDDDGAEDECCYGFGIERIAIKALFEDTKIRRGDVVDMVLYLQMKQQAKQLVHQQQQQEQESSSHDGNNTINNDATMKADRQRQIQHEENIRQCSEYLSLPNRCMASYRAKMLEGALYYPNSDFF